jgi:signal transduction histidine kinase
MTGLFRNRILLLVFGTGVPLLALALFGLWRAVDASKQALVEEHVALAQSMAATSTAYYAASTAAAQTLALTTASHPANLVGLLATMQQTNPDWQSLAVLDATGRQVAAAGDSSANAATIRVPVTYGDGARGTLVVTTSLASLANQLREQAVAANVDTTLIGDAGSVLTTTSPDLPAASLPVSRSQVTAQQVATSSGALLVVQVPLDSPHAVLLVTQPVASALSALQQPMWLAVVGLLVALELAGVAACLVGSRLASSCESTLQACDTAERTAELQSALLASVAHDLQNPLAAARGYVELLQRRTRADPDAPLRSTAANLAQAQRAIWRMQEMTQELVDAARLEAGYDLALRPESTDLLELVSQVVDEQSVAGGESRIRVHCEGPDLWVICDAPRIARALSNVVSNALKYSPTGSPVAIDLGTRREGAAEWVAVAITDAGIGIPPEELPYVFSPFHRASNAPALIGGTGLGLSGVRATVAQHGGSVAVESQLGVGTTVRIQLPCNPAASAGVYAGSERITPPLAMAS